MSQPESEVDAQTKTSKIHLLDVGVKEYGDALLCQFGDVSVMIDGAHTGDQVGKGDHPSIPDQLGELLGQQPPYKVSLLIITHAHEDHIGCLPHLVEKNILQADWALVADPMLGWGRSATDGPTPLDKEPDARVRQVVAALREEVRTRESDGRTMDEFLVDAADLESRYNQMLNKLAQDGTKVVRHGRDKKKLTQLQEAFKGVGLKVLGPSQPQVLACAFLIQEKTSDAFKTVTDVFSRDAAIDASSAYKQLLVSGQDSLDAKARPGAAINLMSIVTSFNYGNHRFLFAGDMQFAKPGVGDSQIKESVRALRQEIAKDAPYSFVKLSHHGSDNAFDEDMFNELSGTKYYGICAGEKSTIHPHPDILGLLRDNKDQIKWARTDHNGLTTFTFKGTQVDVEKTKGRINDSQPNPTDEMIGGEKTGGGASTASAGSTALKPAAPSQPPTTQTQPPVKPEPRTPEVVPPASTAPPENIVEVVTRIPHVHTRVTVTVEVQPLSGGQTSAQPSEKPAEEEPPFVDLKPLNIAGGRKLPPLLFLTNKAALARNIGVAESTHVLKALRDGNHLLDDEIPVGEDGSSTRAGNAVRQLLERNPQVEGVVIIGGYDVVPSRRIDCLPKDLREAVKSNSDPDDFIVWSDDFYGDRDGDGWPEVPVSRIPDGKLADLVFTAIQARNKPPGRSQRRGVRNVARPFADNIFNILPGTEEIRVSGPLHFQSPPQYPLDGDHVYIMLHGDFIDSSRFWGEETENDFEAVNIASIPEESGPVVFTGCCWGALTVDTPANRVLPNRPFGQKTPGSSIAMSFLLRGATAFIGCTGAHYSPIEEPYDYFGGPMHRAFWRAYKPGDAPAKTLLAAKTEYLREMPHKQTKPLLQAIEYKILRQYTCLGLGW